MPYSCVGANTVSLGSVAVPGTFTIASDVIPGCLENDTIVMGIWTLGFDVGADILIEGLPAFSLAIFGDFASPAGGGPVCGPVLFPAVPSNCQCFWGGTALLSESGDLSVNFPNIETSRFVDPGLTSTVNVCLSVAVYRNLIYRTWDLWDVAAYEEGWESPDQTCAYPAKPSGPLTSDEVAIALVSPGATTPSAWTARNSQIADLQGPTVDPIGYTLSDSSAADYLFVFSIQAPFVSCSSLAAEIDVPYSSFLTAGGGVPPYSYAIISGSLPPGLSLDGATGLISGTPTVAGEYSFTAQMTDSDTSPETATADCTIYVGSLGVTCPSDSAPLGVPYSSSIVASGGTPPYEYLELGTLPPGLSLDASTGLISGTPTMTGDYPFLAAVLDADSNYGFASCEIDVAGVSISCGLPPVGRVGQAYDFTFPVSGGLPPYTISITAGTLPPGLSLDATTGEVTGIPTSPGTFAFTVQVEDSLANTASANCFIEIVVPTNSPLVITFRGVKRRRACLP